jgi:Bacterial protein of unknown function (DUF882)
VTVLALAAVIAPLTLVPVAGPPATSTNVGASPEAYFAPFEDRAALRPLPEIEELSKKDKWLADKARRLDVHMTDRDLQRERREKSFPRRPSVAIKGPASAPEICPDGPAGIRMSPLTTLFNLHTRESLPLIPGYTLADRFHEFLRDYTTNQSTRMDARLIGVLERVALRFSPGRIEVVSGYRSPKYNLMLRKKGREVAKSSQHSEGNAVDFRIRGLPTRRLLNFVKSLRVGGVGYYPHSEFVHSDTGRIRFWRGT